MISEISSEKSSKFFIIQSKIVLLKTILKKHLQIELNLKYNIQLIERDLANLQTMVPLIGSTMSQAKSSIVSLGNRYKTDRNIKLTHTLKNILTDFSHTLPKVTEKANSIYKLLDQKSQLIATNSQKMNLLSTNITDFKREIHKIIFHTTTHSDKEHYLKIANQLDTLIEDIALIKKFLNENKCCVEKLVIKTLAVGKIIQAL